MILSEEYMDTFAAMFHAMAEIVIHFLASSSLVGQEGEVQDETVML